MDLVNWAPIADLLMVGLALAAVPVAVWFWRARAHTPRQRLRALTVLTLFLTFDLVVFGAFTRLTDSGLGCPDWPGCYGEASPLAARQDIAAAQAERPHGPVTHGKAWVEMVHRYWAGAVGLLILALAVLAWRWRGAGLPHPAWSGLTLLWVLVQGAFGALTVTWKLFPAIVTLHLLFGLGLVLLLALQAERLQPQALALPDAGTARRLRALWHLAGALLGLQIALGGWVSTNYAVLICPDLPTCQGQWWPAADFAQGFQLWRELGRDATGGWLSTQALTAIHLAHRLGALAASAAVLALAWQLQRAGHSLWARRWALLLAWQLVSGMANVVFGWPLLAGLMHSAGAAGFVLAWTLLGARLVPAPVRAPTLQELPA